MDKSRSSRAIQFRAILTLVGLAFFTSCSSVNRILVDGATQDPNYAGSFTSQVDNPVFRASVRLATSPVQDQGVTPLEEAFSSVSQWTYSYFDLQVKNEQGDASRGAPIDIKLVPEPQAAGQWGASAGQDPWYPWLVRGAQLGYEPILLSVFKERADHTLTVAALPASAVLDPHVMLVPLQVVRVVPQDQNSSNYKWITQGADERVVRNWLDQTPSVLRQSVSHPGGILATVNYGDQTPSFWSWKRPDEIWSQCQVQWRLISVTDLVVEDEAHLLPSVCGGYANEAIWISNYNAAVQQGLVRGDLPVLLIGLRVAGPSCVVHGYGQDGSAAFAAIGFDSENQPLAPSHELGHILGLDDHCGDATDQLMCNTSVGTTIGTASCQTARGVASKFVKLAWGVDVQP